MHNITRRQRAYSLAAALCLASAPSHANDVWQFTVTSDQNGSDEICNEPFDIPCSITGHASSYILGTLTINAPLAVYIAAVDDTNGLVVESDDLHVVSFRPAPTTLLNLNFPPPVPSNYLATNISVNEVGNALSGVVSLSFDFRAPSVILMTGMYNLWTGYWYDGSGRVHQFWAKSEKVLAIAQH